MCDKIKIITMIVQIVLKELIQTIIHKVIKNGKKKEMRVFLENPEGTKETSQQKPNI